MAHGLTPRPKAKKVIGATNAGASRHFGPEFSEIEFLVAIDVIRSAIAEHRKHLDPEVLRSILTKLSAAYDEKRGHAHSTPHLESIRR